MRKYEFTDKKMNNYPQLKQIVAIRSFGEIKEGEIGGWIESESNLSHSGDCWIYNNSDSVSGMSSPRVLGNVIINDDATIRGSAVLNGANNKQLSVYENASIYGGNVYISGDNQIFGSACIEGGSIYSGNKISGNCRVTRCTLSNSTIDGDCFLYSMGNVNRVNLSSNDDYVYMRLGFVYNVFICKTHACLNNTEKPIEYWISTPDDQIIKDIHPGFDLSGSFSDWWKQYGNILKNIIKDKGWALGD